MQEVWDRWSRCSGVCGRNVTKSEKVLILNAEGQACEDYYNKAPIVNPSFPFNSVSIFSASQMDGALNGIPTTFILDPGAFITRVRMDVWDRAQSTQTKLKPWQEPVLVGTNGAPIVLHGTAEVKLKIGELVFCAQVVVTNALTVKAILGLEFLVQD